MVVPPNHPFVHWVFHYFHHPFWGTPIFGNPHPQKIWSWKLYQSISCRAKWMNDDNRYEPLLHCQWRWRCFDPRWTTWRAGRTQGFATFFFLLEDFCFRSMLSSVCVCIIISLYHIIVYIVWLHFSWRWYTKYVVFCNTLTLVYDVRCLISGCDSSDIRPKHMIYRIQGSQHSIWCLVLGIMWCMVSSMVWYDAMWYMFFSLNATWNMIAHVQNHKHYNTISYYTTKNTAL